MKCQFKRGGALGVAEVIANVECRDAFHLVSSVNALAIDGDSAFQAFSQLSPGLKGVVKGLIKRALGTDATTLGEFEEGPGLLIHELLFMVERFQQQVT